MEPDVPPVVAKVVRKGEKNAMIHFSMGEPAWSPDYEIASKLQVGRPLPPDWKVEQGQYGPKALPPRKGQGMAVAYRNTKEAFEAEAASRLTWQQVEEERKDRRTALMQAGVASSDSLDIIEIADMFYEWLRSSPAVSEPAAESPRSGERDVASKSEGQGVIPPPSGGTDKRLAASPAGGTSSAPRGQTGEKPGLGEDGADASASSGEVGADMKPGEVTSSASPGFPISPSDCDHKGASGHWLPTKVIDGQARCPRCGESAVIYRETA